MKLALKIDVDTLRGTREGVPRLIDALQRHNAGATFLFSLGPDHTGRAIKRVFRPGFMKKVGRTSVLEHYGVKTLLYGTALPGPDIGKRAATQMRAARDAGFEVGIHCWDHVKWQDNVAGASEKWTRAEMQKAALQFSEIFKTNARTHGAAGWQMNLHALRNTQHLGYAYSSDTRGTHPFMPMWNAEIIACPQLPTTLPTLDELIGIDGLTADTVHERILKLSENPLPTGHVFTLHAELEGMKLLPAFERLLYGWKNQGYDLCLMADLFATLDVKKLPRHEVILAEIPGRSGTLALQGKAFLSQIKLPEEDHVAA